MKLPSPHPLLAGVAAFCLTACGVSTTPVLSSTTGELISGMTYDEVKAAVGKPAYRYSVDDRETWVYTESNPLVGEAKSMALNMVPVAGPLVTFGNSMFSRPVVASSVVTFDEDGTVTDFELAEDEGGVLGDLPLPAVPTR